MKIHCSYCDCAIDATLEICPHCGAKNDLAATYANKLEEQRRKDHERQVIGNRPRRGRKTFIVCFAIFVFFFFCFMAAVTSARREEAARQERELQREAQKAEELRLQQEALKEKEAYDSAPVSVYGLNTPAEKDRYYSVQVTDAVMYELNYDHKVKEWGGGVQSEPVLYDSEHRLAVQIKLKNYIENASVYNNPTGFVEFYACDENENNISVLDEKFLNGSFDDNYYGDGMMISDTDEFINTYVSTLKKGQSINWWIPLVVSENSKSIVLHFDYNMTVTIDNPWAK